MKVYLAGPMRGIPEFNFPAFKIAARALRKIGFDVFSPAEHDLNGGFDPKGMKGEDAELGPAGFNLRDALAADLAYVATQADMVVVLPGWEKSAGAQAEVATAKALALPVKSLAEALGQPQPSPREQSLVRAIGYVCGDRNASYGPPTQDFKRTAALWTAFGFRFVPYDGAEPQPIISHHVANGMILLKQSRTAHQPGKADSWDDTSGYAACGHECAVEEAA